MPRKPPNPFHKLTVANPIPPLKLPPPLPVQQRATKAVTSKAEASPDRKAMDQAKASGKLALDNCERVLKIAAKSLEYAEVCKQPSESLEVAEQAAKLTQIASSALHQARRTYAIAAGLEVDKDVSQAAGQSKEGALDSAAEQMAAFDAQIEEAAAAAVKRQNR